MEVACCKKYTLFPDSWRLGSFNVVSAFIHLQGLESCHLAPAPRLLRHTHGRNITVSAEPSAYNRTPFSSPYDKSEVMEILLRLV